MPASTPPLPGTWRRRKRHGPWALRPPPTLEVPHHTAPSAELPEADLAEQTGAPVATDPTPTAQETSGGFKGAFGSQVPATGDTPAPSGRAASASGCAADSMPTTRGHDDRASLAEASVSIANTEIQSSVATEPSNGLDAMPGTELQHSLQLTERLDTAPATMPATLPPTQADPLGQPLDVRLDAAALRSARAGRYSHGTPDTAAEVTPLAAATLPDNEAPGGRAGGSWGSRGRMRSQGRHTNPGSSGCAARTPHLGAASEGGSERPCSVGTAIQDGPDGASPDTQPTPVLTQVECPQDTAAELPPSAMGIEQSAAGSVGAAAGGVTGVHDEVERSRCVGGVAVAAGDSAGGASGAASEAAGGARAVVAETPSASGDGGGGAAGLAGHKGAATRALPMLCRPCVRVTRKL